MLQEALGSWRGGSGRLDAVFLASSSHAYQAPLTSVFQRALLTPQDGFVRPCPDCSPAAPTPSARCAHALQAPARWQTCPTSTLSSRRGCRGAAPARGCAPRLGRRRQRRVHDTSTTRPRHGPQVALATTASASAAAAAVMSGSVPPPTLLHTPPAARSDPTAASPTASPPADRPHSPSPPLSASAPPDGSPDDGGARPPLLRLAPTDVEIAVSSSRGLPGPFPDPSRAACR